MILKTKSILKLTNISKSFGGVRALKEVNFHCKESEIHGIAGENGAGKSTLLKICSGLLQPDEGEISVFGEKCNFDSPSEALQKGIAMVYQELNLIPEMTVLDNIFLNIESTKNIIKLVDLKEEQEKIQRLIDEYNIDIELNARCCDLSVAQQQMVEILKALIREPQIIILDEPTSALSKTEVEKLNDIIFRMKESGKSIIFITHRMEELFGMTDSITVLKDGNLIGNYKTSELSTDRLIRLMVGRELTNIYPQKRKGKTKIALQLNNVKTKLSKDSIDLAVHVGEILGIGGLEGQGQSELLNCIYGIETFTSGSLEIFGENVSITKPWQGIENSIAMVPQDRKTEGLFLPTEISKNLTIANLFSYQRFGVLINKKENKAVSEIVDRLNIKTNDVSLPVSSLSGGNQQKVVLGKALLTIPKILLFNEPTRGIDVEAKREFYHMIHELAEQDVTVIFYSSDMMELIGLSSRIIVMYEGSISGELTKQDVTEEEIMALAVGIGDPNEEEKK